MAFCKTKKQLVNIDGLVAVVHLRVFQLQHFHITLAIGLPLTHIAQAVGSVKAVGGKALSTQQIGERLQTTYGIGRNHIESVVGRHLHAVGIILRGIAHGIALALSIVPVMEVPLRSTVN